MSDPANQPDPGEEDFDAAAKAAVAARSTWISVVVNTGLSVLLIATEI